MHAGQESAESAEANTHLHFTLPTLLATKAAVEENILEHKTVELAVQLPAQQEQEDLISRPP